MAAMTCLPPKLINKFKQSLKDGEINPFELSEMSSQERRDFFKGILGGEVEAKWANAQFESKLLLKNQEQGFQTWAKKLTGMTKDAKRDLFSRIERLDRVLSPEENQQFLEDLAEAKLGIGVSEQEAKQIMDLSNRVTEGQAEITKLIETDPRAKKASFWDWKDNKARRDLGYAKVDLKRYVDDLKIEAEKVGIKEGLKTEPIKTIAKPAGAVRSIVASGDLSFTFRQGWGQMFTDPKIWAKSVGTAIKNVPKDIRGKTDVAREYDAMIMSNPYFELAQKSKLALLNMEEAMPSSAPEKIPGLGRLFRASETSFSGAMQMMRMDAFAKWAQAQDVIGTNWNSAEGKKLARNWAKFVNSNTGRGDFGSQDNKMDTWNKLFFSPRLWKSRLDILTFQQLHKDLSMQERKVMALKTARIYVGTIMLLALMKGIFGDDAVEEDARSSDFGKLKIGNTRFELTGGIAGLATLVSRQVSGKYKSTTSGQLVPYEAGFGKTSRWDALLDYMENKLSPVASVGKQLAQGEDYNGEAMDLKKVIESLTIPIGVKNAYAEKDPHGASKFLTILADALGVGTNTYGAKTSDWSKSDSQEMKDFKEQVGEGKLKEAYDSYTTEFEQWYADNEHTFKSEPNEERSKVIQMGKDEIKKKVLKDYGYKKPKAKKKSKSQTEATKQKYGL